MAFSISHLRALVLFWGFFCFPVAALSSVVVDISLTQDAELELGYTFPPSCKQLNFIKSTEDAGRLHWRKTGGCAEIKNNHLQISGECNVARFRLPISNEKTVAYPAAFAVGKAVYVHTSNFSVQADCGALEYRFVAPQIAAQGHVSKNTVVRKGEKGEFSVLLLPQQANISPFPIQYFDESLGQENIAFIQQVANETVATLRRELPDAPFSPPILAVARPNGSGGARVEGDASDVVRLALINWPQRPDPERNRLATMFVSHEFSHRFQLRDAVDIYPEARLIHEGGAEFLRWWLAIQKGWLTEQEAGQELDRALTQCLLGVGQDAWREIAPQKIADRRLEYSCGLAAYVYGLAAQEKTGAAFAKINHFYRKLGQGEKPDFMQEMECGASPHCKANWLPSLLKSEKNMRAVWQTLLSSSELARVTAPNQAQKDALMAQLVQRLMKSDCNSSSYFLQTDGVIFDHLKSCKNIIGGTYLKKIEGLPLFQHADTLAVSKRACTKKAELKLSMSNGSSIAIKCPELPEMEMMFFSADMQKIMPRLIGK